MVLVRGGVGEQMKHVYLVVVAVLALTFSAIGCTTNESAQSPTAQLSEEVQVKGSDTMVQMASNLAEGYMEQYPERRVSVTGGGSGTGIAALINGEVDIADASRPIKSSEVDLARTNGIEPIQFIIARDAITVIVHPSNPINQLTVEQLSDIYTGKLTNWKDVGGQDMEITLYGRQSTSGTYAYFLEEVVNQELLGKKDLKYEYSPRMRNMEGNTAIVDAVARDTTGIGYIGLGYIKETIKPVNVAKTAQDEYVVPSVETIASGDYPITRTLNQYTAGIPKNGGPVHEFLKYELSPAGQQIAEESGFMSVLDVDKAENDGAFALIES